MLKLNAPFVVPLKFKPAKFELNPASVSTDGPVNIPRFAPDELNVDSKNERNNSFQTMVIVNCYYAYLDLGEEHRVVQLVVPAVVEPFVLIICYNGLPL